MNSVSNLWKTSGRTLPVLGILLISALATAASDFYVAPDGDDVAAGTREAPFRSLERARDAARGKPEPTIVLMPGNYPRTNGLSLGAADSGLTIRASLQGTAVLDAAYYVPASAIGPANDPRLRGDAAKHVRVVDLQKAGLPALKKWPDFFIGGGGLFDLYSGETRLKLATWPEDGPTVMKRVVDPGDVKKGPNTRGGTFEFHERRIATWTNAANEGRLWLVGSWYAPWRYEALRVASLNVASQTITFATATDSGIGSKYASGGTGAGNEPWRALNLIEELDRPGEWAVDFDAQKIFVWPAADEVVVATMAQPMIAMKDATNVSLVGLTFQHGLGSAVEIKGGASCSVVACEVRRVGADGVVVAGGTKHRVESCDLFNLGAAGIVMGGGDRKTLTPAGHVANNNHIHDFARTKRMYAPGIALGAYGAASAVSCTVSHNRIHNAPHAGILLGGNDNVIELNEIYDVVKDSDDMGAIYTYHDWTSYNFIRHNFIHNAHRVTGYYADDADSGDVVEGNVFYRVATGPFSGGGHDNLYRGNISIACLRGAHIDARGIQRGYATDASLFRQFDAAGVTNEPWRSRHPQLLTLTNDHPEIPRGTVIESNVVVACDKLVNLGGKSNELARCRITNNVSISFEDAAFADPANLDFTLRPESAVFKKLPGFAAIPFRSIGLVTNEHRRSVPSREARFSRGVVPAHGDTNSLAPSIFVSSPSYQQVIQRDAKGVGRVAVAGRVGAGVDEVRFRIIGQPLAGELPSGWTSIRVDAATRTFSTPLTLPAGGWYRMEVYAYLDGQRVATWYVDKFAVGDVFIVAGQSNAGNYGSEKTATQTKRVVAFDGKQWHLAEDPLRGAGGTGGSFMPSFGDSLTAKTGVPVGVVPIAVGATSVREWLPKGTRMTNQPTTGKNVRLVASNTWEATGALFDTLADRLTKLGPNGCRAILWHQGESDAGQARGGYPADRQITGAHYADFMRQLITASRTSAGWQVPWLTALATYHSEQDASDAEFRTAQKSLWGTNEIFPGPDTDTLRADFRSGVHFNAIGLKKHGELWTESARAAFPALRAP